MDWRQACTASGSLLFKRNPEETENRYFLFNAIAKWTRLDIGELYARLGGPLNLEAVALGLEDHFGASAGKMARQISLAIDDICLRQLGSDSCSVQSMSPPLQAIVGLCSSKKLDFSLEKLDVHERACLDAHFALYASGRQETRIRSHAAGKEWAKENLVLWLSYLFYHSLESCTKKCSSPYELLKKEYQKLYCHQATLTVDACVLRQLLAEKGWASARNAEVLGLFVVAQLLDETRQHRMFLQQSLVSLALIFELLPSLKKSSLALRACEGFCSELLANDQVGEKSSNLARLLVKHVLALKASNCEEGACADTQSASRMPKQVPCKSPKTMGHDDWVKVRLVEKVFHGLFASSGAPHFWPYLVAVHSLACCLEPRLREYLSPDLASLFQALGAAELNLPSKDVRIDSCFSTSQQFALSLIELVGLDEFMKNVQALVAVDASLADAIVPELIAGCLQRSVRVSALIMDHAGTEHGLNVIIDSLLLVAPVPLVKRLALDPEPFVHDSVLAHRAADVAFVLEMMQPNWEALERNLALSLRRVYCKLAPELHRDAFRLLLDNDLSLSSFLTSIAQGTERREKPTDYTKYLWLMQKWDLQELEPVASIHQGLQQDLYFDLRLEYHADAQKPVDSTRYCTCFTVST